MKKLNLLIIALLTFCSLTIASEIYLPFNGISYFFKASEDGTSATLMFDNLEGEEINFTVDNAEGTTFMAKTIVTTGKVKEDINFKSLPEGQYTFKMTFEDKVMMRKFFVTPQKTAVMMNYQLTSSNQKFKISVEEENLVLIIGNDVKGFIKVRLTDEQGDDIYHSKFVAGAKNVKRFDLSTLPSGNYNAEMEIDGVTYKDSFSIL
ncbi:DUF3244 domain-containing protein [Flammeovirga kamogawensis]|uniref:Uncharacterized protein n=1 Tax=Flammeovirga kamogawensis TaxID=373891 RepID=A0ABX8H0X5_9BACT|nr:hypothetical protein [Flammeovirga kamogawensis]MBB6459490.1 hypothetical protein [Flammeovirga kamogawensis]QWG09042.1 hypothetical protein KM029_08885 [Flammeovirga kamogawensis]TRX67330.1 hypothetical protein EO216_03925 [Flammeovirga kamogawensis]